MINDIIMRVKAAIPWNESFPFVQPASTSALVILGFSSLFSSRFVFCVRLYGDYMPFLDMKKRPEKGLQNGWNR